MSPAFIVLYSLSQMVGLCALILIGYWMGHYEGGFEWGSKNPLKFNYHPLFMVFGLVFLYGEAILTYRLLRKVNKFILKLVHMALQLAALVLAIVALVAVFTFHKDFGYPNVVSVHSWIGLGTFSIFGLQFIIGFVFYLFPKMNDNLRALYMPIHRYWGVAIFCMACTAAITGIAEKAGTLTAKTHEYYVANVLAVCIVVFGWLVTYLVTREDYKRPPAEDEDTLMN